MNKKPLVLTALATVTMLASCGAVSGGSAISVPPSEQSGGTATSSSQQVTPVSQEEGSIAEPSITLDALHVVIYQKFIAADGGREKLDEFKTGFNGYLAQKGVTITTLTYDELTTGNVAAFSNDIKNFEADNYNFDIVLGTKAVSSGDVAYFTDTFEVYNVDGSPLQFDFAGSTERRVWTRKTGGNDDAIFYMINYIRTLVDLPEIPEGGEEVPSSEEPIESSEEIVDSSEEVVDSSEEIIVSSEEESLEPVSSEEASSHEPVTIDALHVFIYTAQVSDTAAVETFKTNFAAYLTQEQITITTITWDNVGSGKIATLSSEIEAFEADSTKYLGDVVLGAKAVSASTETEYYNNNFEVYKVDGNNVEFAFGGKTDRRLWTRKSGGNDDAIQVMKDYVDYIVENAA